jgi:predicted DNA-binding transcriptional regulator AlpA
MTANPALTPVDTQDPVYTIEHVAALFHVMVDTAREYTYRTDFPAAYQLGARLLWDREDILAWFRSLPRLTLADRRRAGSALAADAPAAPRAARATTYQRRAGRGTTKASA